jgi:hypothetical protein
MSSRPSRMSDERDQEHEADVDLGQRITQASVGQPTSGSQTCRYLRVSRRPSLSR